MLPSPCSTSTAYQHSFSEATLERKEKLAMAFSISLFVLVVPGRFAGWPAFPPSPPPLKVLTLWPSTCQHSPHLYHGSVARLWLKPAPHPHPNLIYLLPGGMGRSTPQSLEAAVWLLYTCVIQGNSLDFCQMVMIISNTIDIPKQWVRV